MTVPVSSREPRLLPSGGPAERLRRLVRRRGAIERCRSDRARARRGLVVFAAIWSLVAILEGVATGAVLPGIFALQFGLVVPWAVVVGNAVDRRAAAVSIEREAGGVAIAAVLATLAGHRLDPTGLLPDFDAIAVLPLLHLVLVVRPRPIVAACVAAIGFAVIAAIVVVDAATPARALGLLVALAGVLALAVVVARDVEAGRHADRLARLVAEITVHRLTHHADELRLLSEVDTLTGLANRRAIDRRLPEIAERSTAENLVIGVMMIDVDRFKRFNDLWGHQAGDRCLVEVARAAAEQIRRNGDLIGRFGGEEFLVALPGAGLEATMRVAERIRAAVGERRVATAAGDKRATVSIGCAAGIVGPAGSIEDLVQAADRQLYVAKAAGRDRVAPTPGAGTPEMHEADRRVA